ncbi:HCO3 transporter family-domain-containing protein [Pavlovales sp. CCMP2436]|nr:HCO3 transporter family-domain-containing protein [Pavlovales sp. CCMP2436]
MNQLSTDVGASSPSGTDELETDPFGVTFMLPERRAKEFDHLAVPAQRFPQTGMSRREWSVKGLPLDFAKEQRGEGDIEAKALPGSDDAPLENTDDGLPPVLKFHRLPGKGLWVDIKRRSRYYRTDWTDAFLPANLSIVVSTILFMLFACLAPALAFGSIYETVTKGQIGIIETLLATGVCGVINAITSGQPLTISGPTGPELAYVSTLIGLCSSLGIEFMPAKFWAGMWQSLYTVIYTLLHACSLISYVTRFTEEIFSAMISLIEIVAAGTNIVNVFLGPTTIGAKLWSLLIVSLTYILAVKFRELRTSDLLNASLRQQLSNYGVSIVIISLTILSSLVTPVFGILDVKYLNVPTVIQPTWVDPLTGTVRPWIVKAFGYAKPFPPWAIFLMALPAVGGTLLGYLDQNLTEVLVNRKDRMFKKQPAYHLSNFVLGMFLYPFCAILGLPAGHPATVRSLAHVMAVTSTEVVPLPDGKGTTVRVTGVAEQRMTHLAIHVLILICLTAGSVLRYVPQPIIIGVFLFLGIASIRGNQMFDRLFVLLSFERERWPNYYYVQDVDRREMTRFTLLQTVIVVTMVAISRVSQIAIVFPFLMATMVPVRIYLIPRFFSKESIDVLDL